MKSNEKHNFLSLFITFHHFSSLLNVCLEVHLFRVLHTFHHNDVDMILECHVLYFPILFYIAILKAATGLTHEICEGINGDCTPTGFAKH